MGIKAKGFAIWLASNILSCSFFTVSGLSGSKAVAQEQVSVGMGLLAGSTVMLLTVIWGSCVVVGKCDLCNAIAVDSQDTKGFSLTGMATCFFISTFLSFTKKEIY